MRKLLAQINWLPVVSTRESWLGGSHTQAFMHGQCRKYVLSSLLNDIDIIVFIKI